MITSGIFYYALVKAILLYGFEKLVITVFMMMTLEGVHKGFSIGIVCMCPGVVQEGMWVFSNL